MAESGGGNGGGGGGGGGAGPPPPPPPPPPGSGPGGSAGPGAPSVAANLDQFYALIALHSQIYQPIWTQRSASVIGGTFVKMLNASVARIALWFFNMDATANIYCTTRFFNNPPLGAMKIPPGGNQYMYFAVHGSLPMHDWFVVNDVGTVTSVGTMELLIKDVRLQATAERLEYDYRQHQTGQTQTIFNPLDFDRFSGIPGYRGTGPSGSVADIIAPNR